MGIWARVGVRVRYRGRVEIGVKARARARARVRLGLGSEAAFFLLDTRSRVGVKVRSEGEVSGNDQKLAFISLTRGSAVSPTIFWWRMSSMTRTASHRSRSHALMPAFLSAAKWLPILEPMSRAALAAASICTPLAAQSRCLRARSGDRQAGRFDRHQLVLSSQGERQLCRLTLAIPDSQHT